MEYKLEPITITKELILSRVSEETIMEHYLGITPKKGLFKSPLRVDNRPTVAFFRSPSGDLVYKDFGSDHCGDFIKIVMIKFNCSYWKALQIIANDFGIVKNKNVEINKPLIDYTNAKFDEKTGSVIQVEIKEFSKKELEWWNSFGINQETLEKFKVYSCKNVFLNDELFYTYKPSKLVFGYFGGIREGIERWKLYFPLNIRYRWLSNWKKTQLQGSHMLPKEGGEYLIIQKSLKDVMLLYSFGIPAIAPMCETSFLSDVQYTKLSNKFIYKGLCFDNDLTGVSYSNRIHKKYPELPILFIPRSSGCKDLSDFYKMYGREKTLELIENGKEAIKNWRSKAEEKII